MTYPHYSFAELMRTEATPPHPVGRVAGRIKHVYPRNRKGALDIQNFHLEEDGSGLEIKCGWFDLAANLMDYKGGYLELESTAARSLEWTTQGDGSPKKKLEIRGTARVIHLLRASEYNGPLSLQSPTASAAPSQRRVEVPLGDVAEGDRQDRKSKRAELQGNASEILARIRELHSLCYAEAVAVTEQIRDEDSHRRSTPPEGAVPFPGSDYTRLLDITYESMAKAAVQERLYMLLPEEGVEPEAKLPSSLEVLAARIGANEAKANNQLVVFGKLKPGQTYRDLSETVAAELIAADWKVA
jgi:hypothetical protein